jgi:hypothetical protein
MFLPVHGHSQGHQQRNTVMADSVIDVHVWNKKIQCFQLKLLKIFKIYTIYKYFTHKCFITCILGEKHKRSHEVTKVEMHLVTNMVRK